MIGNLSLAQGLPFRIMQTTLRVGFALSSPTLGIDDGVR